MDAQKAAKNVMLVFNANVCKLFRICLMMQNLTHLTSWNQSCSLKGNQTGKVKVDSKTLKVDYEFGYPLSF